MSKGDMALSPQNGINGVVMGILIRMSAASYALINISS